MVKKKTKKQPAVLEVVPDDGMKPAERAAIAIKLRITGASMDAIAEHLGVAKSTISRDLSSHLKELTKANEALTEDYRALQNERLEAMMFTYFPLAKNGDDKAAWIVMNLIDRLNRLWQVDELVVNVNHRMTWAEVAANAQEKIDTKQLRLVSNNAPAV